MRIRIESGWVSFMDARRMSWGIAALMMVAATVRCQPEKPKLASAPKTMYPTDPFASGGVLSALPSDTQYKFKPGPPPPNELGEREKIPFPPPEGSEGPKGVPSPPKVKPLPLRVVHFHPRGQIRSESAVTVTFNQPMVPLASIKDVKKAPLPLRVEPAIEGRARWLGVDTVRYQVKGRLRFSTRFKVTVPLGTKAVNGALLDKAQSWTFDTPRLKLANYYPSGDSNAMDQPVVLVFNQRVDPEKIFAATRLMVRKTKRRVKVRLVPRDEWRKEMYGAQALAVDKRKPGRVMMIKPLAKLRFRQRYLVVIKKGIVAGEGPLPSDQAIRMKFGTWQYYPLKVDSYNCPSVSVDKKGPQSLVISFNNTLDPKRIKRMARFIRVTPRVRGMKVTCKHERCTVKGRFALGKIYRVSVAPGPRDSHGQRLARRWSKICYLPHVQPRFGMPGSESVSLVESRGPRRIPLHAVNLKSAQVRMVNVPLDRLFEARRTWGRRKSHVPIATRLPGQQVSRKVVFDPRVDRVHKKQSLALDDVLGKGKPGLVYVETKLQPRFRVQDKVSYVRRVYLVTDLGLAVRYDRHRLLVLVTSLETGKPVGAADLALYTRRGRKVFQGKTNGQGLLEIKQPLPKGRSSSWVVFASHGQDRAFVDVWSRGWSRHRMTRTSAPDSPFEASLRSLVFTERNPYRPGETAHLTGILRVEDLGLGGGVEPVRGRNVRVRLNVFDPRGRRIRKNQMVSVDEDGMFTYSIAIPKGGALGNWRVKGKVMGTGLSYYREFTTYFKVLHYRTPEYAVAVKFKGEPRFLGESIRGEVTGRYYFGSSMAGAEVRWRMRRTVGSYRPPNHDTFAFGDENPYRWSYRGWGRRRWRGGWHRRGWQTARGKGKLDQHGRFGVRAKTKRFPKPYGPGTVGHVTLEAEVVDKSRQVIAASGSVIAHPAAVYVGLRPRGGVLTAGKDSAIEVVAVNLGGKRVVNRQVKLLASRLVWPSGRSRWWYRGAPKEIPAGGCSAVTGREIALCKIVLPKAGQYVLRATTTDAKGRSTRSVTYVYAVGKTDPSAVSGRQKLELILDKKEYKPGEHASVLIKSPYDDALGILTVERSGIREYRLVRITSQLQLVRVRVTARDIPNLTVSLLLVRGRDKRLKPHKKDSDPGAPAFKVASASVRVSTDSKRLRVKIHVSPSPARPGGSVTLKISARDHRGRPARARLAVMVVDEGVLSLLGFKLPDPVPVFHQWKSARTATRALRSKFLKLQDVYLRTVAYWKLSKALQKQMDDSGRRGPGRRYRPKRRMASPVKSSMASELRASPGGRGKKQSKSKGKRQFRTRSNFTTTALYSVVLATNVKGEATHTFRLPDNLTTFRINAVAVGRDPLDRFGVGETRLTVRQPLMLMPALPRFANFGDRFEAAVKITNESGKKGRVKVKLQATNALVIGPPVRSITLAAGQTEEVRFPVAVGRPGRARFRFLAYIGPHTDAVVKSIAVNLPATAQAFATYGVTTGTVVQKLKPPADALSGFGGLDLSYASTALTGLEDSVRYLLEYPYGCTEQISSRLLPLVSLKKILPAFGLLGKQLEEGTKYALKVPPRFLRKVPMDQREDQEKAYIQHMGQSGIVQLLKHQRSDGGFGFWSSSRRSSPYLTAYATYALLRARQAGFTVPDRVFNNAAGWLGRYMDQSSWWTRYHWSYSLPTRVMAAWVASELRKTRFVSSWTKRRLNLERHLPTLFKSWKRLPIFARAWLMVALHRVAPARAKIGGNPVQILVDDLDRAAIQDTPYRVHFRESTTEGTPLLMHSTSRTDAIVLSALMEVKPRYPLALKVVKGLLAARIRGRWESTQSNAYALTALSAYFAKYEKEVPDFSVKAWLGRGFLGGTKFKGRTMRVSDQRIPMAFLQRQKGKALIVQKKGAGRLYYRMGLRYTPRSLRLKAEQQGMVIARSYEAVAGKGSVEKLPDGRYRVKGGKLVRVKLTIKVPSRRYFVVVDDPLPAGFEIVDMQLKTSSGGLHRGGASRRGYSRGSWVWNHKEKRDDRMLLFADRLWAGNYTYTYLVRATTLGSFIAPPSRIEEMYHPEVMGHTATSAVEVVK
jgi:alpha-2-macroglobulin